MTNTLSMPRRSVHDFSLDMERKLRVHEHKGGWEGHTDVVLCLRLLDEYNELLEAIESGDIDHIIDEAADVANFAHMIADNARRRRTPE